jgi:hypothetical protein
MNYRTLFNVRVGRVRVYGDIDEYISLGVSIGLHMVRVEFLMFGIGITW